jgi:outer membrane protein OmpA-like peptidoglycan-associated protein
VGKKVHLKIKKQMKKHPLLLVACACILFSCDSLEKPKEDITDTTHHVIVDTITTTVHKEITDSTLSTFDITSIPVTTQDIGVFPFFSAPEGYKFNSAKTTDFDKQYFAVNGKLVPLEGKSFNAELDVDRLKNKSKFNALLLEKSYSKLIIDMGGVKVNAIPVPAAEMERVGNSELIGKGHGYALDHNGQNIHTYVIRKQDVEVWIQLYLLNEESGRVTILRKGGMETLKINLVKADEIKKDIETKGKAVLHINFDTDKATMKSESSAAVDEINKLLQQNTSLKVSIEGHTDNTGNAAVNKKLSLERANAVMNALVQSGIAKTRLKAVGYGAERPLVANDTDEGKAQNRRVELVKL